MVQVVAEGFIGFKLNGKKKHDKPFIGDIMRIIHRLRLEGDYEKVNGIDVNIEKINKFKQGVDLVLTSKSNQNGYDEDFSNLYGLVETSSDYSDLL